MAFIPQLCSIFSVFSEQLEPKELSIFESQTARFCACTIQICRPTCIYGQEPTLITGTSVLDTYLSYHCDRALEFQVINVPTENQFTPRTEENILGLTALCPTQWLVPVQSECKISTAVIFLSWWHSAQLLMLICTGKSCDRLWV